MVVAATCAAGAVLGAHGARSRVGDARRAGLLTPSCSWRRSGSRRRSNRSGHGALAAGAAVVGLAAVAGLAWLFARRPGFLPALALAALPFRIPVQAAGARRTCSSRCTS